MATDDCLIFVDGPNYRPNSAGRYQDSANFYQGLVL